MKNKLFIFALVLTLLVPLFGGSVAYAMDYPSDFPALPPGKTINIIYIREDDSYYLLTMSDVNFTSCKAVYSDGYKITLSSTESWYFEEYSLKDGYWVLNYELAREPGKEIAHGMSTGHKGFVYSDISILDTDSNVVFPLPPGPLGMPEGTLVQTMIQENPLNQILILLPMVTVLLVGYLGLRKGLAILRTTLKKA